MSTADSGSRPGQDQEPGFFRTLVQDFRRVMADIHRVGLRRSMGRTLTELQEFYFTTEHRDRLASMGRVKRWLFLAFWLLKSLFLRLTPARGWWRPSRLSSTMPRATTTCPSSS